MLVHTIPKNGYESIASCNLDFLGFGEDWKPDITIVSGLRLLLDRAVNVDEAIELLSQYDMHFSLGRAHPYALSLGQKDW